MSAGQDVSSVFLAGIACAGLAFVACADPTAVCPPLFPTVPTVVNAAVPADPTDVTFTELWRVGGQAEGQELGTPVLPALGPDRRIAVPDFQLGEVVVIEADGTWLGSVARQGPGPGEFSVPVGGAWAADGRLHVFDFGKPAVITFDASLAFESETPVDPSLTGPFVAGGELAWAGITARGHLLVRTGVEAIGPDPTTGQEALLLLRAGRVFVDTLIAVRLPIVWGAMLGQWPAPGWPRLAVAVAPDGSLALGGWATDGIALLDPDARPLLQFCTGMPAEPLSAAERGGEAPPALQDVGAAIAAAPRPETPAAFGRIVLGADGSIWVQRERQPAYPDFAGSMYGAPGTTWDVYARDGTHRTAVRMPPAARLQAVSGDTIWTYEVGALDDISVVAYRMDPPVRSTARAAASPAEPSERP